MKTLLIVAGWLAAGGMALAIAAHLLAGDGHLWLSLAHSFAPVPLVPSLVLVFPAMACRRWGLSAVFGAEALVAAIWLIPIWPATAPPDGGIPIRVVTANLLMINADPGRAMALIDALDADVVVLQEVSPGFRPFLESPEALTRWPTRDVTYAVHSFGIAALSRLPGTIERIDAHGVTWLRGRLEADGVPVTLIDVHPLPPNSHENHALWRSQHALLREMATGTGHRIVAGDLNATHRHPTFRRLLDDAGLVDTAVACGRRQATWPWDLGLLRLDHVLVSEGIGCAALTLGPDIGSDHQPVVADLVIPRDR